MIRIRPIREGESEAAKRVIYRVAQDVFKDPRPLEESIQFHEAQARLQDMDDIQRNYFHNGGIFLVMQDGQALVGTGAVRALQGDVCELKRLWLLTGYHGQGLGYRMLQELLTFARRAGYGRIWLQTDANHQTRALAFYRRIGFREIPPYADGTDDIAMELIL